MEIADVLAANLRNLRRRAGLSQEQLAELTGTHRTYVGRIEQGKANPTIDLVGRIARALRVEPAALLFEGEGGPARKQDARRRLSPAPAEATAVAFVVNGDEYRLESIQEPAHDLTAQVLCQLIDAGYRGDELAARYDQVRRALRERLPVPLPAPDDAAARRRRGPAREP